MNQKMKVFSLGVNDLYAESGDRILFIKSIN